MSDFERNNAHGGRFNPSRDQTHAIDDEKRRFTRLHEQSAEYEALLDTNRYPINFGDERAGVTAVLLPLGDAEAVERLMRDIEAFGYGIGQAPHESAESLIWANRCKAAQAKLREHFVFLASRATPTERREPSV